MHRILILFLALFIRLCPACDQDSASLSTLYHQVQGDVFIIDDDTLEVFNFQGRILADVLLEDSINQKLINIFPYVTRCTLDIILETAMGVQLEIQHARKSEY